MKNYLVTIRIADGSNYETTVEQKNIFMAAIEIDYMMDEHKLQDGEIISIVLADN